jgi:hypothetical protein
MRKRGIAEDQPSPRCNSIGFILELSWVHFVEILESGNEVNLWLLQVYIFIRTTLYTINYQIIDRFMRSQIATGI